MFPIIQHIHPSLPVHILQRRKKEVSQEQAIYNEWCVFSRDEVYPYTEHDRIVTRQDHVPQEHNEPDKREDGGAFVDLGELAMMRFELEDLLVIHIGMFPSIHVHSQKPEIQKGTQHAAKNGEYLAHFGSVQPEFGRHCNSDDHKEQNDATPEEGAEPEQLNHADILALDF